MILYFKFINTRVISLNSIQIWIVLMMCAGGGGILYVNDKLLYWYLFLRKRSVCEIINSYIIDLFPLILFFHRKRSICGNPWIRKSLFGRLSNWLSGNCERQTWTSDQHQQDLAANLPCRSESWRPDKTVRFRRGTFSQCTQSCWRSVIFLWFNWHLIWIILEP